MQSYVVHEELLCKHSPFFQAAVKKEWNETRYRIIPLPDDKQNVVSLYVNWIYAGRILSRTSDLTNGHGSDEMDLLVDTFVFGEKIQDGHFKDAVIDAAIKSTFSVDKDGIAWFPGVTAVNRAYEGTPSGSPLRRLMVDFWARRGLEKWERKGLNSDFLTDLVGELLTHQQPSFGSHPTDGETSTCSYHQHGDDDLCYSRSGNT